MTDRLNNLLRELKYLWLTPVGFFYCLFMNLLLLLIGVNDGSGALRDQALSEMFSNQEWMLLLINLVIAPILEELLFRKLLYQKLFREKLGVRVLFSALVSAAVFAVLHLNVPQGIYAFFLGLVLCETLEHTGSLAAAVFVHAAANLFTILVNRYEALNEFLYALRIPAMIAGLLIFLLALGLFYQVYAPERLRFLKKNRE